MPALKPKKKRKKKIRRVSRAVKSIEKILINLEIDFIREHRFDDCRNKLPLPFDFYLPEYSACIEYDGEFHFIAPPVYKGEDKLLACQLHDQIKNQYCEKMSFSLLRISYLEKTGLKKKVIRFINELGLKK